MTNRIAIVGIGMLLLAAAAGADTQVHCEIIGPCAPCPEFHVRAIGGAITTSHYIKFRGTGRGGVLPGDWADAARALPRWRRRRRFRRVPELPARRGRRRARLFAVRGCKRRRRGPVYSCCAAAAPRPPAAGLRAAAAADRGLGRVAARFTFLLIYLNFYFK